SSIRVWDGAMRSLLAVSSAPQSLSSCGARFGGRVARFGPDNSCDGGPTPMPAWPLAGSFLVLVVLRGRRTAQPQRLDHAAALARHDDRAEAIEVSGRTRVEADAIGEIEPRARGHDRGVVPLPMRVLQPQPPIAIRAPVADATVVGKGNGDIIRT